MAADQAATPKTPMFPYFAAPGEGLYAQVASADREKRKQ